MKTSERIKMELMEAFKKAAEPHKIFAANLRQEHGDWCALRYLQVVSNPSPPVPSPKENYKGKRRCFCPKCGGDSIKILKTSPIGRALKIHLQCNECGGKFTKQDNHNGRKW